MKLENLKKGEPLEVTEDDFFKIVAEVGSETFHKQYNRFEHSAWEDIGFYIHIGDIDVDETFQAVDCYMLVIGNVKANFVNAADPQELDVGELIIIGNVECNYFTNWYGKCTFIDGNLTVNKVMSVGQDNSSTVIISDLQAEFYHTSNGWANVGGMVDLKYGLGYIFPLEKEKMSAAIHPKHSEKQSAAFLGTTVEAIEDGDFIFELFEKLS